LDKIRESIEKSVSAGSQTFEQALYKLFKKQMITKEEALRKRFNVTTFSTLVIFKGETEAARTTADSRPEQLKPLFAKAL